MEPVEPEPTRWAFPPPEVAGDDDLVCIGGDLEPGTLLAAYRSGLFPMPVGPRGRKLGWFSPLHRGVMPLDGFHVSRTLRRSIPRFEIGFDTCMRDVMMRCGDRRRPHGWINEDFVDAYERLHRLGWVHSAEAWRDGRLVGGVYGVAIGGLFAGESMFHEETDASKVVLFQLVERLRAAGFSLFDVQWKTDHLASLGVMELDRGEYLARLAEAVDMPVIFPP